LISLINLRSAIDAAFFFGVRDDCVLRDADGSVWPNSAEIGALLSADSAATLFLSPVVSSMFSSTTSNAIHVGNDDAFVPSSSSSVPEPFVTPAKSELFSLDKRRTDSLFRLPEPSLLSQERVPHAPTTTVVAAAASSTTSNGTFVHPTPQPPTRRNSGHPRDVFMLAFGGSVHRITVPPSAQLPAGGATAPHHCRLVGRSVRVSLAVSGAHERRRWLVGAGRIASCRFGVVERRRAAARRHGRARVCNDGRRFAVSLAADASRARLAARAHCRARWRASRAAATRCASSR
jgi:hypothetical protein